MNINEIFIKISNIKKFDNYTEYHLNNKICIKNTQIKKIINNLNNSKNTICLYNKITFLCDIIGVVDINNIRYIDFDDNYYTLMNKGIDAQTNDYL